MEEERKIILGMHTIFLCTKCGHKEPTHDKNGAKEWLEHCGQTAKMTVSRRFYVTKPQLA